MGWQKLRAKLSEHQNSSVVDVEYLVISQVYFIYLEKASLMSRKYPHDHRLDLKNPEDRKHLFEVVEEDIGLLKSKISKHYHELVEDIREEIQTILSLNE